MSNSRTLNRVAAGKIGVHPVQQIPCRRFSFARLFVCVCEREKDGERERANTRCVSCVYKRRQIEIEPTNRWYCILSLRLCGFRCCRFPLFSFVSWLAYGAFGWEKLNIAQCSCCSVSNHLCWHKTKSNHFFCCVSLSPCNRGHFLIEVKAKSNSPNQFSNIYLSVCT